MDLVSTMFGRVNETPFISESNRASLPQKNRAPQGRLVGMDLVRIVGVVAIVAGHVFGGTQYWIYSWHVPLFFFLSGYLWRSQRNLRDEASRRARALLVPYTAWLAIVSVTWAVILSTKSKPFSEPIRDLLLGGKYIASPYSAFWFVTSLFAAAVIMRATWNVHPLLPVVVGAGGLVWIAVSPQTITKVPLAIGLAIPGIFIMCVGLWFSRIHPRIRRPHLVGPVVLAFSFSLAVLQVGGKVNMKAGLIGYPISGVALACAISAGLLLTSTWLADHLPNAAASKVVALAECGLMVILTHSLVISTARFAGISSRLVVFALALTIPFALALLIRRTPFRFYLL
jgi:acyltransferase